MHRRELLKIAGTAAGAFASPAWARNRFENALSAGEVVKYPLPDALVFSNGKPVTNPADWKRRRAELIELFAGEVYGRIPPAPKDLHSEHSVVEHGPAFEGAALRKQIEIRLSRGSERRLIRVLLYLPAQRNKPVAVFTGLNFEGNHAAANDPQIILPEVWKRDPADTSSTPNNERRTLTRQKPAESDRGQAASRWQAEKIVRRGYGLATAYCGDIEPDFSASLPFGVRSLFFAAAQREPAPNEWGALAAWGWGLSRILDYLQSDRDVDSKRVALMGHSRLGKAAMWAAARDQRFALVISNESGVGGASLYRAKTGETIEHLNTSFPHWFAVNFHKYTGHPDQVPVDGNDLLSLMAPRPLYVASAEQDRVSNPTAEFFSATQASKVYELMKLPGLQSSEMPAIDTAIMTGRIGYHVRSGKHDVTAFDWEQYLNFADRHFRQNTPASPLKS